ncbi:hypothetical protein Syun_025900 [Stephania yunnanensis]|uniref:Uncharacterized protein n=1 Tax=Stephania yunnanensis TaxID=152371 RepID=A0AAP0EV58_9MAGN
MVREMISRCAGYAAAQAHVVRVAHKEQATFTIHPGVEPAVVVLVRADLAMVSGMSRE